MVGGSRCRIRALGRRPGLVDRLPRGRRRPRPGGRVGDGGPSARRVSPRGLGTDPAGWCSPTLVRHGRHRYGHGRDPLQRADVPRPGRRSRGRPGRAPAPRVPADVTLLGCAARRPRRCRPPRRRRRPARLLAGRPARRPRRLRHGPPGRRRARHRRSARCRPGRPRRARPRRRGRVDRRRPPSGQGPHADDRLVAPPGGVRPCLPGADARGRGRGRTAVPRRPTRTSARATSATFARPHGVRSPVVCWPMVRPSCAGPMRASPRRRSMPTSRTCPHPACSTRRSAGTGRCRPRPAWRSRRAPFPPATSGATATPRSAAPRRRPQRTTSPARTTSSCSTASATGSPRRLPRRSPVDCSPTSTRRC